jgi:delta-aminolevulinic acid dehydratase/porphobilinogen synthase
MAKKSSISLIQRPRRNRKSLVMRRLVQENILTPQSFVYPVFIIEGKNKTEPIVSMPGISRMSIDLVVKEAKELISRFVKLSIHQLIRPKFRLKWTSRAPPQANAIFLERFFILQPVLH